MASEWPAFIGPMWPSAGLCCSRVAPLQADGSWLFAGPSSAVWSTTSTNRSRFCLPEDDESEDELEHSRFKLGPKEAIGDYLLNLELNEDSVEDEIDSDEDSEDESDLDSESDGVGLATKWLEDIGIQRWLQYELM